MHHLSRQLQVFAFLATIGCTLAQAQTQTSCRTPLGVPCHTITFQSSQWQTFRNGALAIQNHRSTDVHALGRDGSRYHSRHPQAFVFFGGSEKLGEQISFYSGPDDRIVRIFHDKRSFSRREPVIWHDRPYRLSKDGDQGCKSGIRHYGTDFRQTGIGAIAGVPVVKWERGDGYYFAEEVHLAPSLDCATLKLYSIRRTSWHFPQYVRSIEAKSIEWGDPRPDLFLVPAGYQQVEDPSRAGLLRFVERNSVRRSR